MRSFWKEHWGDDLMVVHGVIYRPEDLSGFIALEDEEWVGLITYIFLNHECEIVSLDSLREGQGIGSQPDRGSGSEGATGRLPEVIPEHD